MQHSAKKVFNAFSKSKQHRPYCKAGLKPKKTVSESIASPLPNYLKSQPIFFHFFSKTFFSQDIAVTSETVDYVISLI